MHIPYSIHVSVLVDFQLFYQILLYWIRTSTALIHSPFTHGKTHGNHFFARGLVNGSEKLSLVCIFLTSTTFLATWYLKRYYLSDKFFLFRMLPALVAFNITLILSTNTGVGLDTLITIDLRWYWSITDSLRAFFSAVNSVLNVYFRTAVLSFYDNIVDVDPSTENNPMINLPLTLSCPWSSSTNTLMFNSSSRGSINCSSISSIYYVYLFPKSCFIWTFS